MVAPLCECHSILMLWHTDPRAKAGGYWRCRETNREKCRRYRQQHPDNVRETNRERNPRRVRIGDLYIGLAKSPPEAEAITNHLAEKLTAFKSAQAIERQEMRENGWIEQTVA